MKISYSKPTKIILLVASILLLILYPQHYANSQKDPLKEIGVVGEWRQDKTGFLLNGEVVNSSDRAYKNVQLLVKMYFKDAETISTKRIPLGANVVIGPDTKTPFKTHVKKKFEYRRYLPKLVIDVSIDHVNLLDVEYGDSYEQLIEKEYRTKRILAWVRSIFILLAYTLCVFFVFYDLPKFEVETRIKNLLLFELFYGLTIPFAGIYSMIFMLFLSDVSFIFRLDESPYISVFMTIILTGSVINLYAKVMSFFIAKRLVRRLGMSFFGYGLMFTVVPLGTYFGTRSLMRRFKGVDEEDFNDDEFVVSL